MQSWLERCWQASQGADTDLDSLWQELWGVYQAHHYHTPALYEKRPFLNEAIRALAQLSHPALLFILWFYKRHAPWAYVPLLTSCPQLADYYEQITTHHGACLEVLPLLKNTEVSVVLLTYNRLPLLKEKIRVFQNQTQGSGWKVFVANHGSTDGTTEYLEQLDDPRFEHWHIAQNERILGQAKIYETFCEKAPTELIMQCTDDDWIEPEHLEKSIQAFQNFPWVAAAGGAFYVIKSDRKTVEYRFGPFYPQDTLVNPMLELQRCAYMAPLGNEFVLRKSMLPRYAAKEALFRQEKPDLKVNCWDYMLNINLFAHHDVAYIAQHLCNMYSDPFTSFASRDNSQAMFQLMVEILCSYKRLFPHLPYPRTLADTFVQKYGQAAMRHLQLALNTLSDKREVGDLVEKKSPIWDTWLRVSQLRQSHSAQEARVLI